MKYGKRTISRRKINRRTATKSNGITVKRRVANPSFVRMVNKLISKKMEVKYQAWYPTGPYPLGLADPSCLYSDVSGFTSYYVSPLTVFSQVVQGTDQGERLGNQITINSLNVKCVVYDSTASALNGWQAGAGPFYVDVFVGYRKDYQSIDNKLDEFYDDGNVNIDPTGASKDLLYKINTDLYTILKRKRCKVGLNTYSTGTISYNDYKQSYNFNLNLTKLFKGKKVKYNDNLSDPSNEIYNALSIWCTVVNPTTGVPIITSPNQGGLSLGICMNYVVNLGYTDA